MNRKKQNKELVAYLLKQPWLSKEETEEINASVGHWMQNPASRLPFFSNGMRDKCFSFINHSLNNQTGKVHRRYISESQESYQHSLKFQFDDLPYPPPTTWDFTFIDLFAGIGGFRQAFQAAGGKCDLYK